MTSRSSARRHRGRNVVRVPRPAEAQPEPKLWPASHPAHAIQWWRNRLEKPLFVYFIQHGDDGPVKIGKAFDPSARLIELQCGNPFPLELRGVVVAADRTEERLHALWRGHCIRGEWFGAQDRIIALAKRTQREQVDAFKRGTSAFDIACMPAEQITQAAKIRLPLGAVA